MSSQHGTLPQYINHKCRCEACRAANRAYHRAYQTALRRLSRTYPGTFAVLFAEERSK